MAIAKLHSPGCSWPLPRAPMTWLPLNVAIIDNDRGDSPSSYIARALTKLGLVLQGCPRVPLGCMQGGSRCPGRAVEPERARWYGPVLGRWLGLTPERPSLCLRGFPGRPRVALSRVSDPPGLGWWVGVREPRGRLRLYRLGGRYARKTLQSVPPRRAPNLLQITRLGCLQFFAWPAPGRARGRGPILP